MTGAVLGVDPGRDKAGFALLDRTGSVIEAGIAPVEALRERLGQVVAGQTVAALALGRGTNAPAVAKRLRDLGLPIHLVDEYETSRRARELYFRDHPPHGWRRLVPIGLQLPPRPVDDYAAILIARRFLARGSGP
ncbi:MAG: pre-16S rRNA-processing nuclease YqgF [Candidatus Eremiobacteraeota bacterium]|nr:pre-16S rRNA-processing nuclease YqgF [Candidatus Eremiobacteraeota bacterium]MBV8372817.1 pre-16S rRNA-processing nuclease YqgF [Candidatus Eremiobacteraeota bacterium]